MLEARAKQEDFRPRSTSEARGISRTNRGGSKEKMANEAQTKQREKRIGAAERKEITEAFRRYAANVETAPRNSKADPHVVPCEVFVSQTLSVLRANGKPWIIEAVKAVYFVRSTEPLRKNEIDSRVTKYSITRYVSRSTVYSWLSYARKIYWAIAHHDD